MGQPRPRRRAKSGDDEPPPELSFEEAFTQMQTVIALLERGDVPLDEAVSAFERGMHLAQHCTGLLDHATLRIQALEVQNAGGFATVDIEVETE